VVCYQSCTTLDSFASAGQLKHDQKCIHRICLLLSRFFKLALNIQILDPIVVSRGCKLIAYLIENNCCFLDLYRYLKHVEKVIDDKIKNISSFKSFSFFKFQMPRQMGSQA